MTSDRHRWLKGVERILAEPAPDRPPPQVGRYRILREIGRGGAAVVYEAEDAELRRRVALKVLRDADTDPTVLERLKREAAILAGLLHPNIVGVHEVGSTEGLPFIAMDLIEGRTLAELLREGAPPLPELLRMLRDAARAAAFAHSKGIVHRDLKPGNVLVEKGGRVLLTDFGLAHADSFLTKLTRSRAVMGTPQYMAPEQVEGRTAEIGPRTDVYALGVMLYEALAGALPFPGETAAVVYQKILKDDPLPPGAVPALQAVCLRALEKEPARRYPSADAFADDLDRYLEGGSVEARPPSPLRRLWRRRKGWIVAGAAALMALAAGGGLVRAWREEASARSRKEEDLAGARSRELSSAALASLVKGELDAAIAKAGEAIRLDPRNGPAYVVRADARLAQARPEQGRPRGSARPNKEALEEALRDYGEAIRVGPPDAETHAKRGAARLEKGDSGGAIEDATAALRIDAKCADALYVRGRARLEAGDPAGAAAEFAAVLEASPKYFQSPDRRQHAAEAFYQRARLRASAGEAEGALADCRTALQLSPARWSRRAEAEALLRSLAPR